MQAPKTLEELREAIQTPFRMYELAAAHKWSKEDKKNIGEWIRQLVTKGHAVRFNQEWPTNDKNSKGETILMKPQLGQTVIATAALKAAMDADLAITFGHRPYKLLRKDSPLCKGGYLYCAHKQAEPDEHAKQVWTALSRVVQLSMVTQHRDAQQFFYNEETSQYLIRTTLTKNQVKVWDSLGESGNVAPTTEESQPSVAVPTVEAATPAVDPVAQGLRTACIQCQVVSFMTDADKIEAGGIRYMCEGCRAERT